MEQIRDGNLTGAVIFYLGFEGFLSLQLYCNKEEKKVKFGEATVKASHLDRWRKSWGSMLGSWERTEEGRRREREQID